MKRIVTRHRESLPDGVLPNQLPKDWNPDGAEGSVEKGLRFVILSGAKNPAHLPCNEFKILRRPQGRTPQNDNEEDFFSSP